MATAPAITKTDIFREGESFYVPVFEIKIAGAGLPDDVVRDVMRVNYKDSVTEIDSFDLTVGNWDAQEGKLKYEPPSLARYAKVFDPGQTLELRMGYQGNMRLMLTGQITSLAPSYSESGASTLSVRGLNVLHSFRTEQHTYSWTDMRDSDIAKWMGNQRPRKDLPGLGIEVRINPVAGEAKEPYVFMDNQYDIVFLLERARRHGYEVVLREELKNQTKVKFLYFGPANNRADVPTYNLEWGKSLSSFQPTLSTSRQISAVVVRGWDRKAKRPIEGKVGVMDLYKSAGPEQDRMQHLVEAFENRTEIVTDRPVFTEAQAREMAKDIIRKQLEGMVQASGATVGLPDLRAGRKVQISGLGPRFQGEYFISESTHTIDESGYRTRFTAKRNVPTQ